MKTMPNCFKSCFLLILASIFLFGSPNFVEASQKEAVFAGGCFWCLEHDLEDLPGVLSVDSGYTGGELASPTYKNHKGHQEAVIVNFDTEKVAYKSLLRSFWRNIDPLDGEGQFCDRGDSYRPVVFTQGDSQREEAMQSIQDAARELDQPIGRIKVKVQDAKMFWMAEQYHQNFAERNRLKYSFYRNSCGRDRRLDEVWGENARTNAAWPEK